MSLQPKYGTVRFCEEGIPAGPGSSLTSEEDDESTYLTPLKDNIDKHESISRIADYIFLFLGFQSNPLAEPDSDNVAVRNTAAADMRLTMLSNLASAYNVLSISLSLRVMERVYTNLKATDASLCSSALIAGMILGQLVGGALGDVLGRHRAMAVVMATQIASSLGSAFSVPIEPFICIYQVLAFWRFVLGLSCGAVYPLSAVMAAENNCLSGIDRTKAVALTFSFQGVGYALVPIAGWIIIGILGDHSDLAWRSLLGLGAIPGAFLTYIRLQNTRKYVSRVQAGQLQSPAVILHKRVSSGEIPKAFSENDAEDTPLPSAPRMVPVSIWNAISLEKNLVSKFLGTAGCWFLFDVLFYGNTLFQPMVLSKAFGPGETLEKEAGAMFMISLMSLPGYFVSVYALGRQSPKFIQLQGFFVMGILYLCIGILFESLANAPFALLSVYGSTFFFSNYGPNTTTFVLPSMTFSRACRSTLNGVSAASGKVGALLGASIFVTATSKYGQPVVFLACGLISFIGCILTLLCVPNTVGIKDNTVIATQSDGEDYISANSAPDLATLQDKQCLLGEPEPIVYVNKVRMKVVFSKPSLVDLVRSESDGDEKYAYHW